MTIELFGVVVDFINELELSHLLVGGFIEQRQGNKNRSSQDVDEVGF